MTDHEIHDAEIVDPEPPTISTNLPAIPEPGHGALVAAVADYQTIAGAFAQHQQLVGRLLTEADYQPIGRNRFVKKSGWRKLAVAYGVTDTVIERETIRDERGRPVEATVVVRATAPNGRSSEGIGICTVGERCCPALTGLPCKQSSWNSHTCCVAGCEGFHHFSKPAHDIPATAHTRAKNRAFSDLFAFGEVSAEELGIDGTNGDSQNPNIDRGRVTTLRDRVARFDPKFRDWCRDNFAWPWDNDACDLIETELAKRAPNPPGTATATPEPTTPQEAAGEAPGVTEPEPEPERPRRRPQAQPSADGGPAPMPVPIDEPMRRRIMATCQGLSILDDDRHLIVATVTRDRVQSTGDLTMPEAAVLMNLLTKIKSGDLIVGDHDGSRSVLSATPVGAKWLGAVGLVQEQVR